MLRRHRFIVDRWVWELPGGYTEAGEDDETAAARELVEETGWAAARLEHLATFQPMIGSADSENVVYAAFDCEQRTSDLDVNEAAEVRWIPLDRARSMVRSGEIIGASSVVALAELEARRQSQSG